LTIFRKISNFSDILVLIGGYITWEILMTDQEEILVKAEILDLGKCTRQFVLNARRNVKFLLSLQKESQYSVKSATPKESLDSALSDHNSYDFDIRGYMSQRMRRVEGYFLRIFI
jgi:hypothetical protein